MNNAVIIGSTAIKSYFPDFPREPKDLDIVARPEQAEAVKELWGQGKVKVEILENPIILEKAQSIHLDPDLMLTLKMSHLAWDINWEKHMFDVQFLLNKGAKYDVAIFNELYEYWNQYHGKNKRSDLKMTAAEFFDNALKDYDHDHLHTLINPVPTYTEMLRDGEEVDIDEKKFEAAPIEKKDSLIREEVYVMAFERFGRLHHRPAYSKMLKKYLISHAPMYVFLYAIENYIKLCRPEYDFIKVIEEKL